MSDIALLNHCAAHLDGYMAVDIGPLLTCVEAEALALMLWLCGAEETATLLMWSHGGGDTDPDDAHAHLAGDDDADDRFAVARDFMVRLCAITANDSKQGRLV